MVLEKVVTALQELGSDGKKVVACVKPGIKTTEFIIFCIRMFRLFWHHLIRSSTQNGSGERASTDYFALKLNASSQGVINCDCGG